jgi:hypothetical protein
MSAMDKIPDFFIYLVRDLLQIDGLTWVVPAAYK